MNRSFRSRDLVGLFMLWSSVLLGACGKSAEGPSPGDRGAGAATAASPPTGEERARRLREAEALVSNLASASESEASTRGSQALRLLQPVLMREDPTDVETWRVVGVAALAVGWEDLIACAYEAIGRLAPDFGGKPDLATMMNRLKPRGGDAKRDLVVAARAKKRGITPAYDPWWYAQRARVERKPDPRSPTERHLGVVLARVGELGQARQIEATLTDELDVVDVTNAIAEALTIAGDVAGAKAAVGKLRKYQDGALASVCQVQARQGDIPGAIATADAIVAAPAKGRAWGAVAVAQARRGDIAATKDSLAKIADAQIRAEESKDVAEALAAVGQAGPALEICEGISHPLSRCRAYAQVAQARSAAGDQSGALAALGHGDGVAEKIADPDDAATAHLHLGRAYAEAGDKPRASQHFDAALGAAERIPQTVARSYVLSSIGSARQKAGDAAGSAAVFDKIKALAGVAGGSPSKVWSALVRGYTSAGRFQDALAAAKNLTVGFERDLAMDEIATGQVKADDVSGALATISQSSEAYIRDTSLASIACVRARKGDLLGALEVISKISNPDAKADALVELARALLPEEEDE